MGWKDKLQAARESGQKLFDHESEAVIHEHWPRVQAIFQEKVGPAALKAAQDDQKMEQLFKLVYGLLPFPVHLAVKEDAFVQFCFAHRNELMAPGESRGEATSQ